MTLETPVQIGHPEVAPHTIAAQWAENLNRRRPASATRPYATPRDTSPAELQQQMDMPPEKRP
jgi:hypothetical protein